MGPNICLSQSGQLFQQIRKITLLLQICVLHFRRKLKDENGTVHRQFFEPRKNGILKNNWNSAHKKVSKTEFYWISVPLLFIEYKNSVSVYLNGRILNLFLGR